MKMKNILLGAAIAAGLSAGTAGAHSILVAGNGAPTSDGSGGFIYTYSVQLAAGTLVNENSIKAGDFFVLYDVAGLKATPTFTSPDTFTGTTPLTTSPQPFGTSLPDSPTIANVVFTYTGAQGSIATTGTSPIALGTLTIDSQYSTGLNNIDYAGADENGPTLTVQGNTGTVNGPSAVPASNAGLGGQPCSAFWALPSWSSLAARLSDELGESLIIGYSAQTSEVQE